LSEATLEPDISLPFPIEFLIRDTPRSHQGKNLKAKEQWKQKVGAIAKVHVDALRDFFFLDDRTLAATIFYFPPAAMEGDIDHIVNIPIRLAREQQPEVERRPLEGVPRFVYDADMDSGSVDECEIKVRGEWQRIEIAAALGMDSGGLMRCPECHGRVRAHKAGTTGQRAHFEHYGSHSGCSLKPCTFSGHRSLHPNALQ